jgi:adenylate cyclase
MTEEGFKRKLTAILSADVEGYSRLMGEDEDATIRTLTTYRELMTALIEKYRGRVVDSPGDNLLAEFGSVVDVVRCAVEIQEKLRVRNAELPEDRKMVFRIGINLGDVVEEGERIYGDGINIAARVEGLAEGGGICLSGTVYDSIKNKLSLSYESLGEHNVKNITDPVRVYQVRTETDTAVQKPSERTELPVKPSIAVLPFNNMSGDPDQDYFAEGISEDITTELSRFHSILVISRTSSFTYRGEEVNVRQIGRELGVEYIVEGSVRKAGDRVRVTAQLISSATGQHVWAERYDRHLKDIFAVQDEITETIVSSLAGRIEAAGIDRAKRKATENMVAYDYLLKGLDLYKSGGTTIENVVEAGEMFTKAVELDPGFARGHAWLACASGRRLKLMQVDSSEDQYKLQLDEAMARVQKALSLDENECEAHRIMGMLYLHKRQFDRADYHISKAIALNPSHANVAAQAATFLSYAGRSEEAVASVKRAMRLDPHHPDWYWQGLGHALWVGGQYTNAISSFNRIADLVDFDYAYLAACCVAIGEIDQAKFYVTELLRKKPDATVMHYKKSAIYKNDADSERFLDALRKAGLPEKPPQ